MRAIYIVLFILRILQTAGCMMLFILLLVDLKDPPQKSIKMAVLSCTGLVLAYISYIVIVRSQWAEMMAVPVELCVCLLTLYFCSKDKWQVAAFITFSQFNIYMAIRFIIRLIIPLDSGVMYELPNLFLRMLLYTLLFVFLYKVVRPHFRKLVKSLDKEWNLIALTAFSFWLLECSIQYLPRIYWKEYGDRWALILSSYLLFVVVYGLLFKSSSAFLEKYERREREHILTLQNKIWEEQIEAQKVAVSLARRDRHDLRHHYDTLLALVQSGRTAEVVSYLRTQTDQPEYAALTGICQHPAANAILSRWEAGARMSGVKIELEARVPSSIPMDEVALVGLIANALENAVEGCLRCPEGVERFVKGTFAYTDHHGVGKFHMVVENSCLKDIAFENGYPVSQKKSGGTGTKSIAYTAEQFNGMAEFTAEKGLFRTRVLLHL